MTAVAPEDQPLCGQKRRRGAIEEEHATPHRPYKRTKRRRQSQHKTNTAYWDSLSKVWLTRQALDELDRRNRQKAISVRPPVARSLDLGDEPGRLENLSTQLKRFARYGGPDLRDLGGYPEPSIPNSTAYVMSSNKSSSRTQSRNNLGESTAKTTTSRTKKTSLYDRNFGQTLVDNYIYPDGHDFPDGRDPPRPNNENQILGRLGQPRPSLTPSQFSEKAFRNFKQTNSRALNEDAIMSDVFPVIQGTARIPSAKNLIFGNVEPLTHGNLVDAKPDFYDGVGPTQIDLRIRKELGAYVTPATQGQAPALPNFFSEVKGPDGSAAVAKRQACFDGALGARGVHQLRSFRADPTLTYDDNAYTIVTTYHDGTLKMYTMHPTQASVEDSPEYHMTQLNTFAITGTAERFREGVCAFRNARDWAKEQRDELIAAVNGRVMGMPKISQSTIEPDTLGSETSVDELSQDVDRVSSLSNKRLKKQQEKRSSNSDPRYRSKKSDLGANSRSRSRGRLSRRR